MKRTSKHTKKKRKKKKKEEEKREGEGNYDKTKKEKEEEITYKPTNLHHATPETKLQLNLPLTLQISNPLQP